jgi:hypothetical protein
VGFGKQIRRPHPESGFCHTCQCWWVPFPTKVQGAGWTLCSMCHDCPTTDDFGDIPWEQRRIRQLGFPGQAKYEKLHRLVLGVNYEGLSD